MPSSRPRPTRLKLKVPRNQVEKSLPADSRKKLAGLRAELDD